MSTLTFENIVHDTKAQVLSEKAKTFNGVGTDTRVDLNNKLFIALKGDNFDGHHFLKQALEKKASGALLHRWDPSWDEFKNQISIFLVADTLKALQQLAHGHRQRSGAQILALTGSVGKTTAKEFTAQILKNHRRVHYSKGSFNNHWGVPLSLLGLESSHEVAVIEMGMNHAGEIAELVQIAEPNVVVCTMVGRAHIEHFGSVEKIAEAKEEIYKYSSPESTKIFNRDNPYTRKMWEKFEKKKLPGKIMSFSNLDSTAEVFLKITDLTPDEIHIEGHLMGAQGKAQIPIFGKQNLVNLSAAASLCLSAGLDPKEIWPSFPLCQSEWGRNQRLQTPSGAKIIFDAYNANPDSMKALIENVRDIKNVRRKIGVFGQMLELGEFSEAFHRELGEQVGQSDFSSVYFYGADEKSFSSGVQKFNSKIQIFTQPDFSEALAQQLKTDIRGEGDLIVFKASRGTRLERMLEPLNPLGFTSKKQ